MKVSLLLTDLSVFKDAEGIADVLQFPQTVAGDDHGQFLFLDPLRQDALELQPCQRLESVIGFIQQQQLRMRAETE